MLIRIIQAAFTLYMVMIAVRLIASWFPAAHRTRWLYNLSQLTDPYLNLFRRVIPPIGGVLDLSPLVAYFVLRFVEYAVLRMLLWLY